MIDRVNAIAFASCGVCGGGIINSSEEALTRSHGLAEVFVLRPLSDAHPEAARATQRGERLLLEGKVEEALRELHDAKLQAPGNQVALCNLGCAYFERRDDDAAIFWYREAHNVAPRNEAATLALAHLERRAGNTDDAKWLLANYLQEVNPSCVGALRQLNALHQGQGNWSQAAGCVRRLLAIEPANPEWPDQLQRCLENAGLPGPPPSAQQDGGVYGGGGAGFGGRRMNDPDQVLFGGGQGRDRIPRQGSIDHGPTGGTVGVGDLLRQARQLKTAGHIEAAMSAYRDALRSDCTCVEAFLGVADCREELGEHQAALEAVKQALSVAPDDGEANLCMAEFLLASGRPSPTLETYLQRATSAAQAAKGRGAPGQDQPLRARLYRVSAEAALAREDFKQALQDASEAVRLDASSPKALVLLGTARLRVADYAAALRAFSAALDAGGETPMSTRLRAEVHALCAQANERLRQHPQALAEAEKALSLQPQMAAARIVRAQVLQQGGRSREAALELEAVLQHGTQNSNARLQLGYIQLSAGDTDAITTLEAAATSGMLLSVSGAAKVYLAMALDSMIGDRARAAQVLRDGLKEHRNLLCVWREIERGLGTQQPASALQRLRGICDLDLTSSQARELLLLLSNVMGRADIGRAVNQALPADPRGRGSRPGSAPGSRPGSVPPDRWAPTEGFDRGGRVGGRGSSVQRERSNDRGAYDPRVGGRGGSVQRALSHDRGGSVSPQVRLSREPSLSRIGSHVAMPARDRHVPRAGSAYITSTRQMSFPNPGVPDTRSMPQQNWALPQDHALMMQVQAPGVDFAAQGGAARSYVTSQQRGRGRSSSPPNYRQGVGGRSRE